MQNIFENKPAASRPWSLRLVLTPGCMLNYTQWTPVGINDVEYRVIYNDQDIATGTGLAQPVAVELELEDPKHPVKNNVAIRVANLNGPGNMIKVQVYVQDHCVNGIFLDQLCYYTDGGQIKHGSTYMGENGYQLLEIRTPIYQWLFEHELAVVKEISE